MYTQKSSRPTIYKNEIKTNELNISINSGLAYMTTKHYTDHNTTADGCIKLATALLNIASELDEDLPGQDQPQNYADYDNAIAVLQYIKEM